MRFALTAEHKDFFHKHNYIEFEELLNPFQIAEIKELADDTVASRLHSDSKNLHRHTTKELFQAGYDIWRVNPTFQETAHKNAFAAIASELFQTLPLRFAFDQYVTVTQGSDFFFAKDLSLQDISCLSPLAGALLLPLHDLPSPLPFFPLPTQIGHGLYISPSFPIPWHKIVSTPHLGFLILAFCPEKTHFRAGTPDPHAADLKKLGYAFNDYLKDPTHPLLIRKP